LPSAQVDGFLKIWLGTTPFPIKVIKQLSKKLLTFEEHSDGPEAKLPNSTVYKSCVDTNFHVWYNAMFSGLSQYVHRNLRRRGDFEDSIREWVNAVKIFGCLVEVSKKNQRNLILVCLLRNCRLFLESFITGGAELLPKYWIESPEEAQQFCKDLQTPCRIIQHICEHSKKKTDVQLLKCVPSVKRVLETLIFRVREVLTIRGGADAFWLGSLAHRDLRGERIHSQVIADGDDVDLFSSDEDDIDDAPLSAANDSSDEENEQPEPEENPVNGDAVVELSDSDDDE